MGTNISLIFLKIIGRMKANSEEAKKANRTSCIKLEQKTCIIKTNIKFFFDTKKSSIQFHLIKKKQFLQSILYFNTLKLKKNATIYTEIGKE